MADNNNVRWHKVGKVIKKKAGGVCIVVGDPDAKNEQFRYNVELKITDASGKVVTSTKNGFLTVLDPRKRKGITEEQASKIPQSLVSELFFVENNE